MITPSSDHVRIYLRFHKTLCLGLQELSEQSGRKKATTAAWILSRYCNELLRTCPDYCADMQQMGFDGSEDAFFLPKGRQPERVAGPAMILTLDRRTERDLELFAEQAKMSVGDFRSSVIASYLRSCGII